MADRLKCFQEIDENDEIFNDNYAIERVREGKNWISYLRCIAIFDTETTSFIHNGQKGGYCYVWAMKIADTLITGRYLSEFAELCQMLSRKYHLSNTRRLIVWVHNLGFDFQFFHKYFQFNRVFAMDTHEPIRALTTGGVEFRDSFILFNASLATVGRNLRDKTFQKKVGDLDYSLMRHSQTSLTETEWEYVYNDVRVLYQAIKEKMEDEQGMLTEIPMTSTGYVRRYVRNKCLPKDDKTTRAKYQKLMQSLTLESAAEYNMLKDAFQGGFTHANVFNVGDTKLHVGSFDITSSYPTVCCARKFPMTSGIAVDCSNLSEEDFYKYLDCYCCCINITFYDVETKIDFDNIISLSKCDNIMGQTVNNGRIMSASELTTTITEVDFKAYQTFYSWSGFKVNSMIIYGKGYLPKPIIECILDFYRDKTTLKGIKDPEVERRYMAAKALLNAIYGMMVTDIIRDEVLYSGDWSVCRTDSDDSISKYNKSYNRFLFYPWGVWVTAYARERLYEMILHCGRDYLYSDTDSVKIMHPEAHEAFIDECNHAILEDIYEVLSYHGFDPALAIPKTQKGEDKPLGVWDFEGVYDEFKTLGAKRYLVREGADYHLTVAGVSKKKGMDSIIRQAKESNVSPFEIFQIGLCIPSDETGKNSHIYMDSELYGYMTDYRGVESEFEAPSSVYLNPVAFNLSISTEYDALLKTIFNERKL